MDLRNRAGLAWHASAPCDVGLYDAGHAQIGHLFYVFGGYLNLGEVSRHVRVFDLRTEKWLKSLPAPERLPQSHTAIATDGARYIYHASGQLGPQCSPAVNSVFVFDTETDEWKDLPSLPQARYAGTMQLWRGRLHFVGGAAEDRYTPTDNHWSIAVSDGAATEAEWRIETPVPVAGMHRGSIIHQDALYVFGGQQGDFIAIEGDPDCKCTGHTQETYLAECFRLDSLNGSWTRLADLPIPASHTDFSVIVVQEQILLVGGQIYKDPEKFYLRLTDAIQSYDSARDEWDVVGNLPYRLKFPLVGLWNENLFVFGGQRGTGLSDFPGPISREVWVAAVDGVRKPSGRAKSVVFAGKSILMLTNNLSMTGGPMLVVETARMLIEAGARVRLATLGDDAAGWTIAARMGIPVIPIETAKIHAVTSDIVIASTTAKPVMEWVSSALSENPSIANKLVCWVHEIDVEYFLPGGAALKRARKTVFDSKASKDAWEEALGPLPLASVVHLYANSGVVAELSRDRLLFPLRAGKDAAQRCVEATRQEIRTRLGVAPDDFLVLSLATVEHRKGQKTLLHTLTELASRKRLPIKLVLVGFQNKRQRWRFLRRMALREWQVLTPARSYLRQRHIAGFYRTADAFVMNTQGIGSLRGEGFGRATVEAMAAGTVVLGTNGGGTAEVIVDGETGFLFPIGAEGQAILADRLETLVKNPDVSARLATAGQQWALREASEARFFRDLEQALGEVFDQLS